MQRLTIFFLVVALATLEMGTLQTRAQLRQDPFEQSLRLLYRLLEALERALKFTRDQMSGLNLDGVIGPRMASDQLELLIRRYERALTTQSGSHPLLVILRKLHSLADQVSTDSVSIIKVADLAYYEELGKLIERGAWKLDYPVRRLPTVNRINEENLPVKVAVELFEKVTDSCNSYWLGTSNMSTMPCEMNRNCWKFMMSDGFVEYALTHQVFFLEIGEAAGCYDVMESLASRYNNATVSQLMDTFCGRIFNEASAIQTNGFVATQQDLFLEQIALCGLLGYREFLKTEWIESTLAWQSERGCFTRGEFVHANNVQGDDRIRKRSDVPLIDGCSAHKTSVAIGAMTVCTRFLVEAYLNGATYN